MQAQTKQGVHDPGAIVYYAYVCVCALCSVNGILDACESVEETKKVCVVSI